MEDIEEKPKYTNVCCGRAEKSVTFTGVFIKGVLPQDLEKWLREITPVPFIHIIKKPPNTYGHLHFKTHRASSEFYNQMKGVAKTGPYGAIRFVPAHFYGSKVPVTYMKVSINTSITDEVEPTAGVTDETEQNTMATDEIEQSTEITDDVEQSTEITNDTESSITVRHASSLPYEIYDTGREFIVTVNTPGIKDKNEIGISIGDSYNVIIIEGYLSRKNFGKKLESQNPIFYGSFQAEIELPGRIRIDRENSVAVTVEAGITTVVMEKE